MGALDMVLWALLGFAVVAAILSFFTVNTAEVTARSF